MAELIHQTYTLKYYSLFNCPNVNQIHICHILEVCIIVIHELINYGNVRWEDQV